MLAGDYLSSSERRTHKNQHGVREQCWAIVYASLSKVKPCLLLGVPIIQMWLPGQCEALECERDDQKNGCVHK